MPQHLIKRGRHWYVRLAVPRSLQETVGRREFQRTTGTGDLRVAQTRKHGIIADIQAEIDAYLHDDPTSEDYLRRQAVGLRRAVARGDLDETIATELIHDLLEKNVAPDAVKVHAARLASDQQYLPLAELVSSYLEERAPHIVPSTLAKKSAELEALCGFLGEGLQVSEVDRKATGRYLKHMADSGRPLGAQKVAVSILTAFFNWCIRRGHYERVNPWSGLTVDLMGSRRGGTSRARRPWTDDEIITIGTLPHDDPLRYLLTILAYTGMRLNEAAHLRLDDVLLDAGLLVVSEGKTESSVRQVPIHPHARLLIYRLVEHSRDSYLIPGLTPGGADQKRGWAIGKRAGRFIRAHVTEDPSVVLHGLRNTFIHRCELAGLPESTTKLLVGHARQSLTYGLYSPGVDSERLCEAVSKVPLPHL